MEPGTSQRNQRGTIARSHGQHQVDNCDAQQYGSDPQAIRQAGAADYQGSFNEIAQVNRQMAQQQQLDPNDDFLSEETNSEGTDSDSNRVQNTRSGQDRGASNMHGRRGNHQQSDPAPEGGQRRSRRGQNIRQLDENVELLQQEVSQVMGRLEETRNDYGNLLLHNMELRTQVAAYKEALDAAGISTAHTSNARNVKPPRIDTMTAQQKDYTELSGASSQPKPAAEAPEPDLAWRQQETRVQLLHMHHHHHQQQQQHLVALQQPPPDQNEDMIINNDARLLASIPAGRMGHAARSLPGALSGNGSGSGIASSRPVRSSGNLQLFKATGLGSGSSSSGTDLSSAGASRQPTSLMQHGPLLSLLPSMQAGAAATHAAGLQASHSAGFAAAVPNNLNNLQGRDCSLVGADPGGQAPPPSMTMWSEQQVSYVPFMLHTAPADATGAAAQDGSGAVTGHGALHALNLSQLVAQPQELIMAAQLRNRLLASTLLGGTTEAGQHQAGGSSEANFQSMHNFSLQLGNTATLQLSNPGGQLGGFQSSITASAPAAGGRGVGRTSGAGNHPGSLGSGLWLKLEEDDDQQGQGSQGKVQDMRNFWDSTR